MDAQESMRLAAEDMRADRQISKEKYKDSSKKRLENIITTKMRTAFIGALSQFEENFGKMWGHGLPEHECNETQLRMRQIWQRTRNSVLNNGNRQLRTLGIELQQYDIVWLRYQLQLPVLQRQE